MNSIFTLFWKKIQTYPVNNFTRTLILHVSQINYKTNFIIFLFIFAFLKIDSFCKYYSINMVLFRNTVFLKSGLLFITLYVYYKHILWQKNTGKVSFSSCIYTIFYIFIYEDFLSMFKNAFYFYFSSFVSTYPHVSWLQTSLFPFSTI